MSQLDAHFYINFYHDGSIVAHAADKSGYNTIFDDTLDLDTAKRLASAIDSVLTPNNRVVHKFTHAAVSRRDRRKHELRKSIERQQAELAKLE